MYGVLSADITFIGLFICTLIISVVFHRLNETSPLQESQEQQIKDFTLEGVDKNNTEISQAIEELKQEQTRERSGRRINCRRRRGNRRGSWGSRRNNRSRIQRRRTIYYHTTKRRGSR